jgi:hypothetical protein
MAAPQHPAVDLDRVFQSSIDAQIDVLLNHSREAWASQLQDAKRHLESIAQYKELIRQSQQELVACFATAESTEAKAREMLIKSHGAERVLPRWEAAGELAPPSFRQALENARVETYNPLSKVYVRPPHRRVASPQPPLTHVLQTTTSLPILHQNA